MKSSEILKEIAVKAAEKAGIDLGQDPVRGIVTDAPNARRLLIERLFDSVVTLAVQTWNAEKAVWDNAPQIDILIIQDEDGNENWLPVEITQNGEWWQAVEYDYNTSPVRVISIDESVQEDTCDRAEEFAVTMAEILETT